MQTETTVSSVSEFVQRIIELNNVLIQDGGPKNEILLFRGQPNEKLRVASINCLKATVFL